MMDLRRLTIGNWPILSQSSPWRYSRDMRSPRDEHSAPFSLPVDRATAADAATIADPRWLAHRYDPERDAVHLIDADRAVRASATFLTDEYLPSAAQPLVVSRKMARAGVQRPDPVHFVFHSAYCCSTLLAQALDHVGVASTLKEPVILNDLVGWRHRGGDPARVGDVLDSALTLLSRAFVPGRRW